MAFYIKQRVFINQTKLEVSEIEANLLVNAVDSLTAALALEETYDLVLENYVEMEKDLFSFTIYDVLKIQHDYEDHFYLRSTLNRRFVNLLTATRLYLDQAQQHLSHCCDDQKLACEEFVKRTNDHFDEVFGYKFMSGLRNHVQHCGRAVHSVELSKSNRYIGGARFIENIVVPFALKKELLSDFRAATRNEMEDKVDLAQAAREYVTCIGDLHSLARDKYQANVKRSRSLIESTLEKFKQLNPSNELVAVALVEIKNNENNNPQETFISSVLLKWDNVRVNLESKNFAGANLPINLITNQQLTGIPTTNS